MDPGSVAALDALVSTPRLAPYLSACSGDITKARRLYVWNMEVSAAFWGAISSVEVALRNALHQQFQRHFNRPDWWNHANAQQLASDAVDKEAKLRQEHRRQSAARRGAAPGADDVVAALSFGFWSTMVASPKSALEQNKFWHVCAHKAFPNWVYRHNDARNRQAFIRRLEHLRKFRNRVAHHEPIHGRDLVDDNNRLVAMARFMDVELAHLVNGHSRVPAVLSRRDAAITFGDCNF